MSDQENLEEIYKNRFQGKENYRDKVWKTLLKYYFTQFIPPYSRVLDLGGGYGEFIRNVDAKEKWILDFNPRAGENLSPEITHLQQLSTDPWKISNSSLDLIFTSNFFEHLPNKNNLETTLEHAFLALKPQGKVICMGPNISYLPGKYWDFWDHHLPLTEKSLSEVLQLKGFEPLLSIPKFLPYTMVGKRQTPTWMIALYLRCPLAWNILGKQFLVVAQKP